MDLPVVIVGAGPTGLMLALELGAIGLQPIVLERRTDPTRESRATNIHARTTELLDMRGLLDELAVDAPTRSTWPYGGLDTELDLAGLDTTHPYVLFTPQSRTEAVLAARLSERGVAIRRGHELRSMDAGPERVLVNVDSPDGGYQIVASYLIGCDGGRSRVREAAGIGFPRTPEIRITALADVVLPPQTVLPTNTRPGVRILPLPDGVTRVVFADPDRTDLTPATPVTREEIAAALQRGAGVPLGDAPVLWTSRFGNSTALADRYRAGRVLLAGDAAHIHPPAGGQGMGVGIQDAVNLGWKLGLVAQGQASPALLDSYEAERRPVGAALCRDCLVQVLLVDLGRDPGLAPAGPALRAVLAEMLEVNATNQDRARSVSGLSVGYRPARGAGEPPAHPLLGQRIRDLQLRPSGGRTTRLYEQLRRPEFVLLELDGQELNGQEPDVQEPEGLGLDGLGLDDELLTRLRADGRLRTVVATLAEPYPPLTGVRALLLRPDGHVAWVRTGTANEPGLAAALRSVLAGPSAPTARPAVPVR